jgi:hypothetical protein
LVGTLGDRKAGEEYLFPGAILKVAPVAAVNGPTATLNNRDSDITVIRGTWDMGAHKGSGNNLMGIFVRREENLDIRDSLITDTDGKYAINLGDVRIGQFARP